MGVLVHSPLPLASLIPHTNLPAPSVTHSRLTCIMTLEYFMEVDHGQSGGAISNDQTNQPMNWDDSKRIDVALGEDTRKPHHSGPSGKWPGWEGELP